MRDGQRPLAKRARWTFRHLVFGSFIGAYRARRGLGQAKSRDTWNAEYREGSWDYLEGLAERSRHMIVLGYIAGLDQPRHVLDVGCGPGGLLELGRHFPLSSYLGIDISEVAVARARRRFSDHEPRFDIGFEAADFESYTSTRQYDAIVFNESLSYAHDPVAVLDRFQCFLSPDGVFLVSVCYNWWQEPMTRRIMAAYPTLHSAAVINEEGLMWQIRVLRGKKIQGASRAAAVRVPARRWTALRSGMAESRVMLVENIGAIVKGGLNLIGGGKGTSGDDNR